MTTATKSRLSPMEVELDPTLAALYTITVESDPVQVGAAIGRGFAALERLMERQGLRCTAPPRAIYDGWGTERVDITLAMPIAKIPPGARDEEGMVIGTLPGGRALRFVHRGPYANLRETWQEIDAWLGDHGGIRTPSDWRYYAPMWEEYLGDPLTTPPSELVTRIYLTLR